jgi:alpha-tubulin suppressor-like RCC1 family protein
MNQVPLSQYKACSCSDTHCIALTHDGRAFTWALTSFGNKFGQLCSPSASSSPTQSPSFDSRHEVNIGQRVVAVGAGGNKSAGHTALVGENGALYMCGCDRWQQLGLATQKAAIGGNSAGYTWEGGKVWQSSPQRVAGLAGVSISKVIRALIPTRCGVLVTKCHRLPSEETTHWLLTPTSALCTHGVRVQKGNLVLQAKPS